MTSPSKLGKYAIRRELGKGAMGVVYEGYDPSIERVVALKTIRADQLGGEDAPEIMARFRREAQAAGRLRKDVPAHVIVDLLVGPLFYRMFVRHQPLNGAFVSRVFHCVISGIEEID